MTFDEMINKITENLTLELTAEDSDNFNANLLSVKIQGAIIDVRNERNYPSDYTEEKIERDMVRFFSQILNIARYDYNQIGAEGQTQYQADGVTIHYVDRRSLFAGITPLARTV